MIRLTLNAAKDRLLGVGRRLLVAVQCILFLPGLFIGFVLCVPYWIITGKTLPVPKWMEDINEGNF